MSKKKKDLGFIFQPATKNEDEISELDHLAQGDIALQLGEEKPKVEILTAPEDLDKKNYIKISPTFYVQPLFGETIKNEEGEDEELYKVLNPETEVAEKRLLTDKEKREIFITDLKKSKIKYHPTKFGTKKLSETLVDRKFGGKRIERETTVLTNVTVSRFDANYRKKRQQKNKQARKSRQINRKK